MWASTRKKTEKMKAVKDGAVDTAGTLGPELLLYAERVASQSQEEVQVWTLGVLTSDQFLMSNFKFVKCGFNLRSVRGSDVYLFNHSEMIT